MASYQEILKSVLPQQNANPGYGNEVPRYNALDLAPKLAQAIVAAQSEARTKPAIEALSRIGGQYGQATDEAGRQSANALANASRAAYLQAGGSPMELPQHLWGSNPSQGFQTSAEKYDVPYTGLEGMTTGQREKQAALKRQAILDALGIRKDTAEITGYDPDTGKPTLDRWYKERALAKSGSGSSGGLTAYQEYQINRAKQKDAADAQQQAWDDAMAAAGKDSRLSKTGQYREITDEDGNVIKTEFTMPQLIDAYYQESLKRLGLSGQGSGSNSDTATQGTPSSDPVQALIDRARSEGSSDAEIATTLRNKGYNPADYGL